MALLDFPTDVLIILIQNLRVSELAALARTCQYLNSLVKDFGWIAYLRSNPRPSLSLSKTSHWSAFKRARYDTLTDRAWSRSKFIARPLSRPWTSKLQPILAINSTYLVVAAGNNIHLYEFHSPQADESPPLRAVGVFSVQGARQQRRDITGITFASEEGLYVGYHDGALECISLSRLLGQAMAGQTHTTVLKPAATVSGDYIESLSSQSNLLLSLTASGVASLTNLSSTDPTPFSSFVELQSRSWTSYLSANASTPFAAFGTSSSTPLAIYDFSSSHQLSSKPSAILHTRMDEIHATTEPAATGTRSLNSAVYGITQGPTSSPWGSSPQVLVSGWFDGYVRCYDLRSSSRLSIHGSLNGLAPLRPVLSLFDPWSYDPIYSVSCGGGSGAHIAAGSARHSVVAFWDIRAPKGGWSVHAPGNDPSPVYSIILESSRLFGATQSRPFVYDFGPGVGLATYPPLPENSTSDGLRRKKYSKVAYYVTKYAHVNPNT